MNQNEQKMEKDLSLASEILIRGIASIEQINFCLKEKHQAGDNLSLSQVMIRNRVLSIDSFLKIKKELQYWTREQIEERHSKAVKLETYLQDGILLLRQKSGFKRIGRYQILREIGRGGMGVVYAARDEGLGKTVALKILPPGTEKDGVEVERFLREARLAASLDHPGIVPVHEVGEQDDIHYFTMDYVDGLPLSQYVEKTRCGVKKIVAMIRDIAEALAHAHSKNVIHRDIKPANILVDASGTPRVTDFGLARNLKDSKNLTISGVPLGTPAYMSPEQAAGKFRRVGRQSDVYSLGAVLYHLLVGRPPFIGASLAKTIAAVMEQEPVPPRSLVKGLSRDLETICLKCLEKDPIRRYASARSMAADLDRYLKGQVIKGRPASIAYKTIKWVVRNRALSALFLAIATIPFALIYLFFLRSGSLSVDVESSATGKKAFHAYFSVDGHKIKGKLKRLSIFPGIHRVKITAKNHCLLEFDVKVGAGKDVNITRKLEHKQGTVTISSSLSGIDARFVNNKTGAVFNIIAPLYRYPIDTGIYNVYFHKRNHFPKQVSIEVESEKTCELSLKMEAMLLWRKQISSGADINSVHLLDLDRNGALEVVCTKNSGSLSCVSLSETEKLWQIEQQLTETSYRVAVKDLDRDGIPDLILSPSDLFMVINGKTHKQMFTLPNWWSKSFALVDANRDGYDDLVLFRQYRHGIECYNLESGKALWKLPVNFYVYTRPVYAEPNLYYAQKGEIRSLDIFKQKVSTIYRYNGNDMPVNLEIDHRANGELYLLWHLGRRGIFCMNLESRDIVWHYKSDFPDQREIVLCDLENDGHKEILLHTDRLCCIDAETGKLRWSFSTGCRVKCPPPVIGDLDGDGSVEVVLGTARGRVFVLDGLKGTVISEFSVQTGVGALMLLDTDNDGTMEILFSSDKYLYCIRHRPEQQVKIYGKDLLLQSPPCINDLNGDGYLEIIAATRDGNVCCRDGKSGHILWRYRLGRKFCNSPTTADIDGDGKPEVIVPAGPEVIVLDRRGKELWKREFPGEQIDMATPVIADFDGDGRAEILAKFQSPHSIYCLNGKDGDILWKRKLGRITGRLLVANVDSDRAKEVLAISDESNELYCLYGDSGKDKWQRSAILSSHSKVRDMEVKDIDGDKCPEIFAPQVAGYLSCVDGRTGKIRWSRRLRSGNILARPIVDDFDGDGEFDLLIADIDEEIYCLDASTGRDKWQQGLEKSWSIGKHFSLGKADIDGDHLPDVISTSSFHSFCFYSGKDGKRLGHVDKFGPLVSNLQFQDLNNDGRKDLVAIDSNFRLIIIYDAINYFRKIILRSPSRNYQDPLIVQARLAELFHYRNYRKIERLIFLCEPQMKDWLHVFEFYKGVCAMACKDTRKALQHFKCSRKMPASIYDNEFLMAIAYFSNDDKQALTLLTALAKKSILEFDRCHRLYRQVMSDDAKRMFRAALPAIIRETGCDIALNNAFQNAGFMGEKQQRDSLLALSLKYGLKTSPGYQRRYNLYIKETLRSAGEKSSVYHKHEALDILDRALDNLPLSTHLLNERANININTCISLEQGMSDLQRSLAITPEQPSVLFLHGWTLYQLREYRSALKDFKYCMRYEPKNSKAQIYRILCLIAMEKAKATRKELKRAAKRFPLRQQDPDSFVLQILGYMAKGEKMQAYQGLKSVQKNFPRYDQQVLIDVSKMLNK